MKIQVTVNISDKDISPTMSSRDRRKLFRTVPGDIVQLYNNTGDLLSNLIFVTTEPSDSGYCCSQCGLYEYSCACYSSGCGGVNHAYIPVDSLLEDL